MDEPQEKIWNERWRLAALSRGDLVQVGLAAVVLGLLYVLFHFQGSTPEAMRYGRSTILWMVGRWNDSGIAFGAADYSHGWLIPIASLAIVWWKRHELLQAPKAVSWAGLGFVVLGLFLHWFGAKAQLTRVSLFGLIVLLWGIPYYLYGRAVARVLIFPCAFLIFCIPMSFLDSLTLPLRVYMTVVVQFILNGLGFHIAQSGTALHSVLNPSAVPLLHPDNVKFSLEIADPCSGIRSLMAMVAITAIYGYLTQRTLLKKWVLFLAAVPLALAGNTFRILTIAILCESFGGQFTTVYDGFAGYLIFMLFTIPLMILLGRILDSDLKETWRRWKLALLSPS